MTKAYVVLIAVSALSLSGCATEGKFRDACERHLGRPADELIMALGPPENQSELADGGKVLQWTLNRGSQAMAMPIGYSMMMSASQLYCNTRFMVDKSNIVQRYAYEGNACKTK